MKCGDNLELLKSPKFNNMENDNLKTESNNANVLLGAVNNFICFLIGHKYKIVGRSNGNIWGWNDLECKRCKTKSDTLID